MVTGPVGAGFGAPDSFRKNARGWPSTDGHRAESGRDSARVDVGIAVTFIDTSGPGVSYHARPKCHASTRDKQSGSVRRCRAAAMYTFGSEVPVLCSSHARKAYRVLGRLVRWPRRMA